MEEKCGKSFQWINKGLRTPIVHLKNVLSFKGVEAVMLIKIC